MFIADFVPGTKSITKSYYAPWQANNAMTETMAVNCNNLKRILAIESFKFGPGL